jgi:hypothetical protein
MDLEEEVLMLALQHKKISKNKRRRLYGVHTLLCTRLQLGQSQIVQYRMTPGAIVWTLLKILNEITIQQRAQSSA